MCRNLAREKGRKGERETGRKEGEKGRKGEGEKGRGRKGEREGRKGEREAFSPRGATGTPCLNHGLIRIRRGRVIRFCLSLQRSDMSIAARHIQSPRSRGAQCGIVAHP